MSSSMVDLKDLHQAYTRLSEKFKTFWTYHQFLQGVHKTFFGNTPEYKIDFQSLYDEIKNVTVAMTFQPPVSVMESIHRLEDRLVQVHAALSEDDRKISPNFVRRFFERVRTEDEKLLLSILRFYFYARQASHDTLDKMDLLITLVGARKSIDDGHFLPRFPVELQKLFGTFLALTTRKTVNPAEVRAHVTAFEKIKLDIESCAKFEELTERKILETLRTLKHRTGNEYYTVEVLSAILETNLAAKNKFQSLYEEEERRILESSRQLLEIERELERNPRYQGENLQEEFRRFRQYRDDFEKQNKEMGVRHREVARLAESIDTLLARFEPVPGDGPAGASGPAPELSAPGTAVATDDGMPERSERPRPISEASAPFHRSGPGEDTLSRAEAGGPQQATAASRAVSDPLTAEYASRILYSVESIDDGTGSGNAAYGKSLSRMRLEPWEVRAARRLLSEELAPEAGARTRDLLFFDAASLRLRIDEEATRLRGSGNESRDDAATPERLNDCGLCLIRAQETDRLFRQAIEEASHGAPAEKMNELHRSRFRLLRSFSGLWLLHNAKASG